MFRRGAHTSMTALAIGVFLAGAGASPAAAQDYSALAKWHYVKTFHDPYRIGHCQAVADWAKLGGVEDATCVQSFIGPDYQDLFYWY